MENCTVPEQVVLSILVCLPVVSLLRFRSVCKIWCSLIDSSFFINQHFLHQDDSNGSLIVRSMDLEVHDWFLLSGHQFEDRANLDYPDVFDNKIPRMAPPVNGIVCLSGEDLQPRLGVALWNPATKEVVCLPEPPPLSEVCFFIHVALGYVVKANDYKVVRVMNFLDLDYNSGYNRAEAYSLKTNSWRNVDADIPPGRGIVSTQAAYWNGHSFWFILLSEGNNPFAKNAILSFDYSNEVFETIELPNVLSTKICDPCLTMLGDLVAFIDGLSFCPEDGHFDIWVLTKYGVKESWTKLYTIRLTNVMPRGFSKNGKFLLLCMIDSNHPGFWLTLSDRYNQEIKNLHIEFMEVAIYKESLVSVKKMVHER